MKTNIIFILLITFSTGAFAQKKFNPEQQKAIDFLESKRKEFQASKSDSIYLSQNSDMGYSKTVITRGEQADDIEEQIFAAKPGSVVGPFDGDNTFYLLKILGVDSLKRTKVKLVSFFPRGEYTTDTAKFSKHIEKYIDHIKKGKDYGKMIIKDEATVGLRNKGITALWEGQSNNKDVYDLAFERKIYEPYVTKVGNEIQVLYVIEEKRNAPYKAKVLRMVKKIK